MADLLTTLYDRKQFQCFNGAQWGVCDSWCVWSTMGYNKQSNGNGTGFFCTVAGTDGSTNKHALICRVRIGTSCCWMYVSDTTLFKLTRWLITLFRFSISSFGCRTQIRTHAQMTPSYLSLFFCHSHTPLVLMCARAHWLLGVFCNYSSERGAVLCMADGPAPCCIR